MFLYGLSEKQHITFLAREQLSTFPKMLNYYFNNSIRSKLKGFNLL